MCNRWSNQLFNNSTYTSGQIRREGNALIENIITKYYIPEYIIMDQDSPFMSFLMNYLFKKLDIKLKTVVPYNHQSLQAEHGKQSLSNILTKHLITLGQMWPKYLPIATFAYNTFNTPNLGNYSPYEWCLILKFQVHSKILWTTK